MRWGNFESGLQIAGNFGLIAGLVLVAIQINQNTEIARAQLVNESYRVEMEMPLALVGENPAQSWSRAVRSPDELTDEDLVVLDAILTKGWLNLSRLEYLVDLGYAGEVEGPATFYAWNYLSFPFGRRWWDAHREWAVAPAPQAAEVIDRELADGVGGAPRPSLAGRYERLRVDPDRPVP